MIHFVIYLFVAVYNTYPVATVIIQVVDENNNGPRFVYPQYPINPTPLRMYFGAIANDSRPSKPVLDVYVSVSCMDSSSPMHSLH